MKSSISPPFSIRLKSLGPYFTAKSPSGQGGKRLLPVCRFCYQFEVDKCLPI
ncbi:hypothetical protein HMPREF1545_03622 [Oscillibacter sp. KLE 1728]|nr:hypothetical protein HMPREF1545_03622 [Oscillibacter sp. KLE 1728]